MKTTEPPTPRKRKRFVYLLAVAFKRVQADVGARGIGNSAARAGLLMSISPERGSPMAEVGKALDAAAPALSNLTERAVRDGLIERRADPSDGRAWMLVLTTAGKAARARAVDEARTLNARLTEGFTEGELTVVARWLETVNDRFKRPEGDRRGEAE